MLQKIKMYFGTSIQLLFVCVWVWLVTGNFSNNPCGNENNGYIYRCNMGMEFGRHDLAQLIGADSAEFYGNN